MLTHEAEYIHIQSNISGCYREGVLLVGRTVRSSSTIIYLGTAVILAISRVGRLPLFFGFLLSFLFQRLSCAPVQVRIIRYMLQFDLSPFLATTRPDTFAQACLPWLYTVINVQENINEEWAVSLLVF